jgi:hypothetical protein
MPRQAGPARCDSSRAEHLGLVFSSYFHAARSVPEGSPLDRWPLSSLAKRGGVIPGTGYPAPVVWLLVELVVSRLLCHNRRPMVSGVQDPDSSPRSFRQAGGWSWYYEGDHGIWKHGWAQGL